MKNNDEDAGDWIIEIMRFIKERICFICLLIFYSLTILPFCIIATVIVGLPFVLVMCLKEKYYWMMIKVKGKYPYIPSFKEENI